MTRALILAAGQGSRLRPLTDDRPKALVPLLGRPLVEHQIAVLLAEGIDEVRIVTGYRGEMLAALGLPTVRNEAFATSNMVSSMMAAADVFADERDLIVSYGDIVYRRDNLRRVLATEGDIAVMVDLAWRELWEARFADPLDDAETLKLDAEGSIAEIGRRPKSYDEIEGQYTGLFRIAGKRVRALAEFHRALTDEHAGCPVASLDMTSFLQLLIDAGWAVKPAFVHGGWLEVDSTDDLALYERLAADGRLGRFFAPDAAS